MPRPRTRLATLALIACLLVLSLALGSCAGKEDTAVDVPEDELAQQPQDPVIEDDLAPDSLPADDGDAAGEESEGIANAGNTTDQETLDARADVARAFLTVYPANHMRAGGASDDPVYLQLEDWADACLRHVSPSSSLGRALQDDPEGVAAPLGYYEAASVVTDVEVTGTSTAGVNATVTLEGTQQDWQHTVALTESFLVMFDNDNRITDVVSTD